MNLWLIALHVLLVACSVLVTRAYEDIKEIEDDDFAEFEHFEVKDPVEKPFEKESNEKPTQWKAKDEFLRNDDLDDDIIVEDEDGEFEHFQDPDEFEGYPESAPRTNEQPKITITKVPITLRSRWDAYWLEALTCCALAAYAISYVIGRTRNTNISSHLLTLHKPLLQENFALVGEGEENGWQREAENCFTLWCSGRTCCEGMLLTLKLIKRQDLFSLLWSKANNTVDTLQIKVELPKEGDPFVFLLSQKKVGSKLVKEMQDLSTFAVERRETAPFPGWSVWAETAEVAAAIVDAKVAAVCQKYLHLLQYLHISDQYSGPKQMEEGPVTKLPDTERVVILGVTLPEGDKMEDLRPIMMMIFHIVDKLKRLRLSKECLNKVEKNRQRAESAFLRSTHAARQEAAAVKREERRKAEKEKILAEDDPEKQRRWELKEQKRQMKKKNPKMKQLKVKAL